MPAELSLDHDPLTGGILLEAYLQAMESFLCIVMER